MSLWSGADTASSAHRQLLLSLEPPAGRSLETFVPAGNEVAVQHLKRLCAGDGADHRQIYLWGAESAGKSHLLQAACRAVTAAGGRSAWLPLDKLLPDGPAILADLDESLDLVGLDDLDAVTASLEWQRAVFALINESRVGGCRLVMAGRQNPADIGLQMKDLPSRLMWGAVYRLAPLDDAGKMEALCRIGEHLGCTLTDDTLSYLMSNYPRGLAGLVEAVEHLTRAAKQSKRRITVPFIKETLPAA